MTIEETLRSTRELLADGHWTQGNYDVDERLHWWGWRTNPKFCLVGAVNFLQGRDAAITAAKDDKGAVPVLRALGFKSPGWALVWNDERGRTLADVLALIDQTLARLEAEQAPDVVPDVVPAEWERQKALA